MHFQKKHSEGAGNVQEGMQLRSILKAGLPAKETQKS